MRIPHTDAPSNSANRSKASCQQFQRSARSSSRLSTEQVYERSDGRVELCLDGGPFGHGTFRAGVQEAPEVLVSPLFTRAINRLRNEELYLCH